MDFRMYLLYAIIMAILCQIIGKSKHFNMGWICGLMLGGLGLIVIVCMQDQEKKSISSTTDNSNVDKI